MAPRRRAPGGGPLTRPIAVVALGGNALLRRGETPSLDAQFANAERAAKGLRALARKHRLVVTHGNGPQVGFILLRSEAGKRDAYPLSLDVAVAESEGETGYLLQQVLQNRLGVRAVALATQAVVDARDPAFRRPTKPVGPWLDAKQADALRAKGVPVMESRGAWRRVVPSPAPLEIVEAPAIRRLVLGGFVPIAAGGGGVPVVRRRGKLHGVDAVVDKDLASATLAASVGASALYLLTDVAGVYDAFGSPRQKLVRTLHAPDARRLLDEGRLGEGSMAPKVEACLRFLAARPRGHAVIASLDRPLAGTRVVP